MAFLPTNTHSKPIEKIESCGGHSSSSSWPGHWLLRPWLLDKTIISQWLNHLIPSSLSYQAQSPYLPHGGGVDVHFSGAMDCFRQIVKAQGVLGLWNGLAANLLKVREVVSLPLVRLAAATLFYTFATPSAFCLQTPPLAQSLWMQAGCWPWRVGTLCSVGTSDTPSQRS